jgi:D-amino peptidase
MHPVAACELIKEKATEALSSLSSIRVPAIKLPATIEISFHNGDYAEQATWIPGTIRTGAKKVEITDTDPLNLFKRFITTVILSRTIVE